MVASWLVAVDVARGMLELGDSARIVGFKSIGGCVISCDRFLPFEAESKPRGTSSQCSDRNRWIGALGI